MPTAEAEQHKAKRPPGPDEAAENATDVTAIAKLERDSPDVLKALRGITQPMLLREISGQGCRSCRSRAATDVAAGVEAISKRVNFDNSCLLNVLASGA